MNKEFLYNLLRTTSPSGFEYKIQDIIINYLKDTSEKVIKHHSGNVINAINVDSEMKVLLSAHADEIGLMITDIDSNGYIHVTSAGGIRPGSYIGQKVSIVTLDNRIVPGVVGVDKNSFDHKVEVKELFIDIGVDNKEQASKLVSMGDYVILDTTYKHLLNNRFTSRALDDKLGCFIISEALKKAKKDGCKIGVYSLTSVGEETTMRGASFGPKMVKPNLALIIDVTYTTDSHGVGTGEVYLGKGPVLCHSTIVNKEINRLLMESAKRLNISIQFEIAVGRTGTDADKIYYSDEGIPCALISIPLRYMHSPSEVCDFKDVENIINLISDFLIHLNVDQELNPYNL